MSEQTRGSPSFFRIAGVAYCIPHTRAAVVGSMELRVLVAGFPVLMTVVIMVTMFIMVTVVLSPHPKVMHQIFQFWQEKQCSQCA